MMFFAALDLCKSRSRPAPGSPNPSPRSRLQGFCAVSNQMLCDSTYDSGPYETPASKRPAAKVVEAILNAQSQVKRKCIWDCL